jgi:GTP cyclohydrolase IA
VTDERGVDRPRAERAARELLAALGHDPDAPELRRTPSRYVEFALAAYPADPPAPAIAAGSLLPSTGAPLVVLDAIPFRSVCEHHLLPFTGTATIVYAPADWIVGLGHVSGLVDVASRRLHLQERLTDQIADAFHRDVSPNGTLVVTTATHACMWARGEGDPTTRYTVVAARGSMQDREARLEAEILMNRA